MAPSEPLHGARPRTLPRATSAVGTQFTCFTSTRVQILTVEASPSSPNGNESQFTCFTSTKVRMLTHLASSPKVKERQPFSWLKTQ
jgi:hypothetical protein